MTATLATTETRTVRERNLALWQTSSEALYSGRISDFVACWTDDGCYEAALPVPGLPPAISGHDALLAAFSALTASATSIRVEDVVFHQTDDPDVAIVEERMVGELADGWRYENRLAIRVTFRDGKIAHLYEYYGQFAHAELLRHLGF